MKTLTVTVTSIIATAAAFVLILDIVQTHSRDQQHCSTLYLLNVQPYPDENEFSGFDGGLSLIPAAHLAAEEINNRSDILTGIELRVIDIDAEACGRATITKGFINLFRELHSKVNCIVGVIGYPCSSSTNVLAPVTGYSGLGYITLANSVSPKHRNKTTYPNLFHTISSSSVHNKAVVSLMQISNWKRIGLLYESSALYYRSTARDFEQKVHNLSGADLTVDLPITDTLYSIRRAFNIISSNGARIIYWLGTDGQCALAICEAYLRQLFWPALVFILRFVPLSEILKVNTSCTNTEMMTAMEGMFMLDYKLFVEDDTVLYSGWTYDQFKQRYDAKLNIYASQINVSLTMLIYASSFYDQVWTFALAINNSLPSIYSQNLSFSDYRITRNTETISHILKQQFLNLSFQGASGWIQFDENYEISSLVDMFQIQNGKIQHIGIFNTLSLNITRNEEFPDSIPPDTFDTFNSLLPYWLGVCILVAQGALIVLITTNLILMLKWRRKKEIKATSPLLSILMMIGCYTLCMAPVLLLVYRMFAVENENLISVLCYLKTWLSMGIELIFATLFWKMLRIHHIFHAKQMTIMSEYWKDKYLFVYSLLVCFGKAVLLLVCIKIYPVEAEILKEYIPGPNKSPHYEVTVHCKTSIACSVLSLFYSGSLLFLVVLLAIETRHVHIENDMYKDTKKVNAFIFLTIIILAKTNALLLFFTQVGIENGANIAEWLAYFSIPVLCQVCLFAPKTLPTAMKNFKR